MDNETGERLVDALWFKHQDTGVMDATAIADCNTLSAFVDMNITSEVMESTT